MGNNKQKRLGSTCLLALLLLLFSATAWSKESSEKPTPPVIKDALSSRFQEPENSGWQLYMDNDLFIGSSTDRNYTGGIALALNGTRTKNYWFSVNGWLKAFDSFSGMSRYHQKGPAFTKHSLELGITVFTPRNIEQTAAIQNDHPYANLLFLANSRQTILPNHGRLYHSALSVGILGSPAGEWVQQSLHTAFSGGDPKGWDNQISDGGEPTFRYSVGTQKVLVSKRNGNYGLDLLGGLESAIGYSTDAGGSLSFRWGKVHSPWWTFTPHESDYISLGSTQPSISYTKTETEIYLWGGINTKYRFYNAILQGQFRDSAVTFDSDELNHVIAEGWLGIGYKRMDGWGLSFIIRARTQEIDATNTSGPVWGSFILSHSL